jgi:calmodulin
MECQQFIEIMKPRLIQKDQVYNSVNIDKLFKEFDIDNDGYITAPELRQSLEKLGTNFAAVADELTDEDVEDIIVEWDEDGDGRISYSEFVNMIPRLYQIIDK